MVADEQEEGFLADELRSARDRVTVAERLLLLDELKSLGVLTSSGAINLLIARANHHAEFLDARREDFLDYDGQGGLGLAVAVHEGLERERALALAGGGDDGAFDVHVGVISVQCSAFGPAARGGV